jgi:hypothetical protein
VKRAWILRTFGGAMMFLFLAGPSPGNVGGCWGEVPMEVEAPQHCTDEEFWKCQRDRFAGRINDAEFNECTARIEGLCGGATWPAGCMPTEAQSEACIRLLRRMDLAHLSYEELQADFTECNLCP